jgi:hypothetical protein
MFVELKTFDKQRELLSEKLSTNKKNRKRRKE